MHIQGKADSTSVGQELTLEQKTLVYWNLSSSFHDRPNCGVITVADAFTAINACTDFLSSSRPLHKRFMELRHAIITGNQDVNEVTPKQVVEDARGA